MWTSILARLAPLTSALLGWKGLALASVTAIAIGGWIGFRVGTAACKDQRIAALERQAALNAQIAEQDAEIWSQAETRTITRWRTQHDAHAALAASGVPDCALDPAGLRAVRSMYDPADASRAGALVGLVRAAAAPGERDAAGDLGGDH